MWQKHSNKSLYKESLKALEADIQHANTLAAALPKDSGGHGVKMKLGYSPFAPVILFLIEWMDYSCRDVLPSYLGLLHVLIYKVYVDGMPTLSSKKRKVTLREFYAVTYPSLKQLEGELDESNNNNASSQLVNNKIDEVDECGICMENCTKMVLPNCGHSLCITCFQDWYLRSQSCPFCRGSLNSVGTKDLWVLTSNSDIIDTTTVAKHNLRRFYLYVDSLPMLMPEMHSFLHDYMI
ncbi:LOW QUALITY PROTEIN: RING-H2 finger protein ATL47-like [Carica papaya]|uniref:LOW QUALITY PROTEIN: RING-H2 finger protein ATL47-like n=1 Tax=Carica papaya TaxID=3649 RepID=UPI000B8CD143|nr:LOW QUALITY PROTEIN: RING-H2 finger protein ATL47-like [Carica papaya]